MCNCQMKTTKHGMVYFQQCDPCILAHQAKLMAERTLICPRCETLDFIPYDCEVCNYCYLDQHCNPKWDGESTVRCPICNVTLGEHECACDVIITIGTISQYGQTIEINSILGPINVHAHLLEKAFNRSNDGDY